MSEDKKLRDRIKCELLLKLKEEGAYWSYPETNISADLISDDRLIADTLLYLDLDEIDSLFKIYTKKAIKKAWKEYLVPQGDYLYTLNRFLAWYYFDSKSPDQYLAWLQTRHLNSLV